MAQIRAVKPDFTRTGNLEPLFGGTFVLQLGHFDLLYADPFEDQARLVLCHSG